MLPGSPVRRTTKIFKVNTAMTATDPRNSLSIVDNRTGETYEVAIENGSINTMDLRKIKASDEDFGLLGYDP